MKEKGMTSAQHAALSKLKDRRAVTEGFRWGGEDAPVYYDLKAAKYHRRGGSNIRTADIPPMVEGLWGVRMPAEDAALFRTYEGQTRTSSVTEAAVSTAFGYVVAIGAQTVVLPLFGFEASPVEHMAIAAFFTMSTLVRGYAVRRLFNRLAGKKRGLLS